MDSFLDKLFHRLRFGKILKYVPADSVICDIGCGSKAVFLKIASKSIRKGIGLDEKVEDYRDSKLEFNRVRMEKSLPLGNECCDVITMTAVLEHLSFPQDILNECYRSLREGGRLIITTPTPRAKLILEFLAFRLKLIDREEIKDHKNYFWPQEVKKILQRAGFSEDKIKSRYFELGFNSLIVATK